jgi:hypothetical protein
MPLIELPTFLQKLETYSGDQQARLALKLMTLTFLRTTKLRAGRWTELENLDENSAQWRIPAERMKMRLERNEVRRAYNAAEWMLDRRRMMQWWADHLTAIALESSKIVPLPRAS